MYHAHAMTHSTIHKPTTHNGGGRPLPWYGRSSSQNIEKDDQNPVRRSQSQWCGKGGTLAHVECEVQFSLGACHALQKWQRKIPENSPRSSREELSSISKPAVKYVGIDNARSALQTRPGLKRFPLHSLAGDVAVGTVAVVTLRTVCGPKKSI